MTAGENILSFFVPHTNIDPGMVNARFRLISAEEQAIRDAGGSAWTLSYDGIAYSGEVEDYQYTLLEVDYGDAPDNGDPVLLPSFPTLRYSDGARHVSQFGPFLSTTGTATDWEDDGQVDFFQDSVGDDENGSADEDGVVLRGWTGEETIYLIPGEWTTIEVTLDASATENAHLYGWIDFNGDGLWNDSGTDTATGTTLDWSEQIFDGTTVLTPGLNKLQFFVPHTGIDPGKVNARFRVISQTEQDQRDAAGAGYELSFDGIAYSGEVEDYEYEVLTVDYSDAPDDGDGDPTTNPTGSFPTLRYSDGARHVDYPFFGVRYGAWTGWEGDHDYDGQPDPDALRDDNDSTAFVDEGGINVTSWLGSHNYDLIPGEWNTIDFTLSHMSYESGRLYAWIDFNGDGDWDDEGYNTSTDPITGAPVAAQYWTEKIAVGISVSNVLLSNTVSLKFFVPHIDDSDADSDPTNDPGIDPGRIIGRFRIIGESEYIYNTDTGTNPNADPNWELDYKGIAYTGEVEDYQFIMRELDYGDSPTGPTLRIDDGARHLMTHVNVFGNEVYGPQLGVDGTPTDLDYEGRPDPLALGDDNAAFDDETGVVLLDAFGQPTTELIPGEWNRVRVQSDDVAFMNNVLFAWIDFNGDGDWDDSGIDTSTGDMGQAWSEEITPIGGLNFGASTTFEFFVPHTGIDPGQVSARFRVIAHEEDSHRSLTYDGPPNTEWSLGYDGIAYTGEVEDYLFSVVSLDFGDAPVDSTLRFDNGPRHVLNYGPWLSRNHVVTDREYDGQPNADATGDDVDNNGTGTVAAADIFGSYDATGGATVIELILPGVGNNFQVAYESAPGDFHVTFGQVPPGNPVSAAWDDPSATLTVLINDGMTANAILALINDPAVGSPLVATLVDESAVSDEDGILLFDWQGNETHELIPGEWATIQVIMDANSPENGHLYAWIDFNGNGNWTDTGADAVASWNEQIARNVPLRINDDDGNGIPDDLNGDGNPDNIATISFYVPHLDIDPQPINARFRIIGHEEYVARIGDNVSWTLAPVGLAYSGEVEDHQFHILNVDYGDAPNGPTLRADDGARHVLDVGPWMTTTAASLTDSEYDGQPDADATGDNLNGANDENGVVLLDWNGTATKSLVPGEQATLQVTVSANSLEAGYLYAWIDFTGDGAWDDLDPLDPVGAWNEQIADGLKIEIGETKDITFQVPNTGIDPGMVNARFRLIGEAEYDIRTASPNEDWTLPVDTIAFSGEVEDYQFEIISVDYGDSDLPHTLRVDDGARHVINGPFLGGAPDSEHDGQPTADAAGDGDDENGVELRDWLDQPTTQIVPGDMTTVVITTDPAATENSYLYAWIDFNGDADWSDSLAGVWNEQIADGEMFTPGETRRISFLVPNDIDPGMIHARFRLVGQTEVDARGAGWSLSYDGIAYSGEVEDYQFEILPVDYGDMLDSHTLWSDNGARHVIDGPFLAGIPDHDRDGQPTVGALGDDLDNDGSTVLTAADLLPGNPYITQGGVPGLRPASVIVDPAGISNSFEIYQPQGQNGISIVFSVGAVGVPAVAVWNGGTQTLNVSFDDGVTTVNQLMAAIQAASAHPLDVQLVDDEEGVVLFNTLGHDPGTLIPGETAWVEVTAAPGTESLYLYAWINYDGDSDWQESGTNTQGVTTYDWNEQIADALQILSGQTVTIPFFVPYDTAAGIANARFRVISASEYDQRTNLALGGDPTWTLPLDGVAYSGEVEDYQFRVLSFDYGDADVNSTLWSENGARHLIGGPYYSPLLQGTSTVARDAETDGQRTANADGDDLNAAETDEDGVSFLNFLMPGEQATIEVSATWYGYLDGWIDFDNDGIFQADEYLFGQQGISSRYLTPGTTQITISIPENAVVGETSARFRISSYLEGGLMPYGLAEAGEVEDYLWEISGMDYGDAPNTYGTSRAAGGPRHVITDVTGPSFGIADHDIDGNYSSDATGDNTEIDTDSAVDDETGIALSSMLIPGEWAAVDVGVTGAGYLNAWFDFNRDGNWGQMVAGEWIADSGEQIFTNLAVTSATTSTLNFYVPQWAVPGYTFARFRITETSTDPYGEDITPLGLAYSGEVEDYRFTIQEIDYGDAETPYPTYHSQVGARHVLDAAGPRLGADVDHDVDGTPTLNADGDDTADLNDDEDGVVFDDLFWVGNTDPAYDPFVSIFVENCAGGAYVDVWVDFNRDGDWDDADEHVVDYTIDPLAVGDEVTLHHRITVPVTASTGVSYARVRVTSNGLDAAGQPLTPTGLALDGEVEDYQIYLDAAPVADPNGPYWINTNQDLKLDGSGSTDIDIPLDSIDEYQWDFQWDDVNGDPSTFDPDFVTSKAIDVVAWPWWDVIQVPQPRPVDGLTISLRVVDSFGAISDIATTKLFIFDNEPHALFDAEDAAQQPGPFTPTETITFDATDSWHDREDNPDDNRFFDKYLVKYEWDFDYNGTFVADQTKVAYTWNGTDWVKNAAEPNPEIITHSYATYGTYTAVLRVTDSNNPAKTSTYSQVIDVREGNVPPLADPGGPYTVNIGSSVTMDGSASKFDDDTQTNDEAVNWGDSIVKWEWDLNLDNTYDVLGKQIYVSWAQLTALGLDIPSADEGYAVNTVRLRVTDSLGESHSETTRLYIHENQPHAVADATPVTIAPGDAVAFDGTDSWHDRNHDDLVPDHLHDPVNDDHDWTTGTHSITTYQWDFYYDGTFNADPLYTGATASYPGYTQFGVYYAMLRVGDDNSPVRYDYLDQPLEIRVVEGDDLPVAVPHLDQQLPDTVGTYIGTYGQNLVLHAENSYDPDEANGDEITMYQWRLELADGTVLETYPETASSTFTLDWEDDLESLTRNEMAYQVRLRVMDSTVVAGEVDAEWSDWTACTPAELGVYDLTVTAHVDTDTGVYLYAPGDTVNYDARASENIHPLHDIVKYEWDLDGDGQFEFVQNEGDADFGLASKTYDSFTMLTVSVRVTDDLGATDTATVDIDVIDGSDNPTADAGQNLVFVPAYFLDVGHDLVLDGSGSSAGDGDAAYGDSLTYEWDLNGDGQVDATGEKPIVTWTELQNLGVTGTGVQHWVHLTVTDQFGAAGTPASDTDDTPLYIYNNQPTAVFVTTPDSANPIGITTPVKFDGTGSGSDRPDVTIVKYEWDFDGDGQFNGPNDVVQNQGDANFGIVENVYFTSYGYYDVTLRVTDSNQPGKTDTYSVTLEVSAGNQPPEASLSMPSMIETGQGITLDGSGSQELEPGDSIKTYAWTVDGKQLVADQQIVTLTWDDLTGLALTDPTNVHVTLTVTDQWNHQDTAEKDFGIYDNEPVPSFTATPNPVAYDTDVNFDASGSTHTWPNRHHHQLRMGLQLRRKRPRRVRRGCRRRYNQDRLLLLRRLRRRPSRNRRQRQDRHLGPHRTRQRR